MGQTSATKSTCDSWRSNFLDFQNAGDVNVASLHKDDYFGEVSHNLSFPHLHRLSRVPGRCCYRKRCFDNPRTFLLVATRTANCVLYQLSHSNGNFFARFGLLSVLIGHPH